MAEPLIAQAAPEGDATIPALVAPRAGNWCWFPGCEQIAYDHECPDHHRDEETP